MNDGARENQSLIPCEWNQALVLYFFTMAGRRCVGEDNGDAMGKKWLGTACFFVASLFYPIILRNFAYNNV